MPGRGSHDGGRTAGGLDLLLRRGGERLGAHLDGDLDLALAQHLDALALADRALGDELVDGDAATLGEQLTDPVEVDDLVLLAEGVLEALQLGQAHVQSEEHTSELQSQSNLVCRLLLEKKKNQTADSALA